MGLRRPGVDQDPSTLLEIERQVASTHVAVMETLARTHEAYLPGVRGDARPGRAGPPGACHPTRTQPRPDAAVSSVCRGAGRAPATGPRSKPADSPGDASRRRARQPAVDYAALLREVVADKTGYPAEMLTLEMALEGDLGIDSIKRVEILSTLRDRLPDLPEVDTSVLAELSTLGHVVDFMADNLPTSNGAGMRSRTPHPHRASAESPTPAVDYAALLREVVADKTGYPAEMLTLEMALEGDLGIDSIKRVEILSTLRDRLPDLPEVDTSVLAELSTLGHVVDFMADNLPAGNASGRRRTGRIVGGSRRADREPAPVRGGPTVGSREPGEARRTSFVGRTAGRIPRGVGLDSTG